MGGTINKTIILYLYLHQGVQPLIRHGEAVTPSPEGEGFKKAPHSSRGLSKATANSITAPLRCPKSAGTAFAVAGFDRGGIKSSLYRPQDALGFYTPRGTALAGASAGG